MKDKQALREAAERAMHDDWGYDTDIFHEQVTPSVVLALLDECAALAAENAALKELIEQHANSVAVCPNCSHEEPSETDDIVALYRSMETPATDAFLAEVRAQGVEMFADKYRAQLTALPTTPENIFDAAHVSLRYQIFDADEFASQLRKGGAA